MKMREVRVTSLVPIYAAAAAWLVYAMIFPLYRLWHFIICAAVTVLAYALFKRLFPGKVVQVEVPQEPETTGNAELDAVIAQGHEAIARMRALNDSIEDPVISGQINELDRLSSRIFDAVKQNPKKLPEIRTFMNYYLPTTIKLLTSYDNMVRQGQAGSNVESVKSNVSGIMETIVTAYRNRLDSLFEAEAMDISADISVLETMMAKEGLSDNKDFEN